MLAGIVILAAAVVLMVGSREQPLARSDGPIVLVSGRDDHGLLERRQAPLQRSPNDTTPVAFVADGSFVRVVAERGEWLQVMSLTEPQQIGWINDFHLRDRALRTDSGVQVTFVDARANGERVEVAVRPINDPTTPAVWVDERMLREVGARTP